ncbi:alkaline phosphatase D family protein [Kitasatospora purpeofusca]|uniref:alkaline phosphatase D family protein n=1 Tax=Kitasatospora purpeofusca TaxID=67352 RepID=UPI0035DE61D5
MDDSSRTPSEISRRRVVQLLGAGTVAAAAGTALIGTTTAVAHSKSPTGLIAAVLDDTDGHTGARGLTRLLRNAGFTVVALNPNQPVRLKAGPLLAPAVPVAETAPADPAPAGPQDVHLVAFGSFAGASYSAFVSNQRASLQEFVRAGGVVLDLAKSDVPGEGVPYLPVYQAHWTNGVWNSPASRWEDDAMAAVRTDADFNTVYPVIPPAPQKTHPLVQALTESGGPVFTGRRTSRLDGTVTRPISVSWETFGAWRDMRVLLACAPGTSGFPAALLEGKDRNGTGRYLVSSLTIDKCYAADGTTAVESPAAIEDSHKFFHALATYVENVRTGQADPVTATPSPKAGPLVGDVGVSTARIWARPGLTGSWKCEVREGTTVRATQTRSTVAANDDTVLFDMAGLTANTAYTFTITPDAAVPFVPLTGSFRTAPATSATPVTLGFGSCAHSVPNPVWNQIIAKGCEGFVMLGDTPYVDNGVEGFSGTPLEKAHRQHRDFLAAPGIDRLVSSMPVWATWDDHDFGQNNADGTLPSKALYRQAFVAYRANATFGHASDSSTQPLTTRDTGLGVYTSFRRGPVEVFLLDPRWFSSVTAKVCLGPVQMAWLKAGLSASTATFKILASGMTWYNKSGTETDEWHTYTDERNEIFKYIKDNGIKGCVLLTGDVHVSRVLKNHYGTDADPALGYTMWEYVTSPLHRLFLSGEQNYKPTGLQHSVPEPNTFLKLEATLTTLTATWINGSGATVIGPLVLNATDLGYPTAPTGYHKASVAATSDAIDVSGASAAEGAPVVRWLYNGASNQRFQVRPLDGDYVRIVNQNSGKDLSVAGASRTPAAGIVQNTYTSGAPANDEWRLEGDGAGRVRIRNRHSNLYLTAGSTQGSQFTQQPYDAGNNLQTFTISPA